MRVITTTTYKDLELLTIASHTVIVIDVLRASSTIITALNNGCNSIIPATSPEKAYEVANILSREDYLLGGEQKCEKIKGFDLGNSPLEYVDNSLIKGKKLIFTSTNGIQGILKAEQAVGCYIGCLLNGKAVAELLANQNPPLVVLACAGTRGNTSLEDTIAAGQIIYYLKKLTSCEGDDFSNTALYTYLQAKDSLINYLNKSTAAQNLYRLGLGKDVQFCGRENVYTNIPQFKNKKVTI